MLGNTNSHNTIDASQHKYRYATRLLNLSVIKIHSPLN
jgi:hypothetical protein